MNSNFKEPLNIGSDEMVSMEDMAAMALAYAGKKDTVKVNHIPGPEGVRGRNSDNTLIKVCSLLGVQCPYPFVASSWMGSKPLLEGRTQKDLRLDQRTSR